VADENRFASASLPIKEGVQKNNQNEHISKTSLLESQPVDNEKNPSLQARPKSNVAKVNNKWRTKNKKNTPNHSQNGTIFAALDLGTNNCRLLVARQRGNGFLVIDGFSRIVRLGEGVSLSGLLDEKAIERTIKALLECKTKLNRHQPKHMRLIATQACRGASNSGDFLDRVQKDVGLELEIIDQRIETELAVAGCADLIDKKAHGALMFDIGGGSTELAWLDFRGGRPKLRSKMPSAIRSWQSLPVGVVSIAEKFGGKNVSVESFEEMVAFVSEKLKAFKGRKKLQEMIKTHNVHLIGTSGTVTTLGGLHLGLERYERAKVDGLWMRNDDVVDTMRVLLNMSYERRAANSCIGADRADLVLPGCAIFEAIRREWTTKNIRVADRGLREGMLVSMIEKNRVEMNRGRVNKSYNKKQNLDNKNG